jgi:hypothetical protein
LRAVLVSAFVVIAAVPSIACAQRIPMYPEFRWDMILGNGTAVQGGGGVVIPAGIYVRTSVDGGAGVTWRGCTPRGSGRVDVISRFLLDPFRETRFGLSLGGGVSVPYASGGRDAHVNPYLTAVIDIEGRLHNGFTPAVQVGLGGGTRIGIVLRRSPQNWR